MIKDSYFIIGVMSGTSLDGLDLCYVQFEKGSTWQFKILKAETYPYSKYWKDELSRVIHMNSSDLEAFDLSYSTFLAEEINRFIDQNQITELDAVSSHGHTVFHQPERQYTYQIGNMSVLAKLLNRTVVCDFRVQDVTLGGQGAPLVPIGDQLLFSQYHMCLNLGGFSNISYINNDQRIAYDICPVNIVLNIFAQKEGLAYDSEGLLASQGKVNKGLLSKLNSLDYYNLEPPKSLGLEWINHVVLPLMDGFQLSSKDVLCTFVEHIAHQISKVIDKKTNATVLVTGGGAFNSYLMKRIEDKSTNNIVIPTLDIVNYKEALIFGFLGVLKLRNEINCLKSVTGATQDHSSGKIFHP